MIGFVLQYLTFRVTFGDGSANVSANNFWCACPNQYEDLSHNEALQMFVNHAYNIFDETNINLQTANSCMVQLKYINHLTAYNSEAKNPQWGAYVLDPNQQKCNAGGRYSWASDPTLKVCGNVAQSSTGFTGDVWGDQPNGDSWDRGHTVPSYAMSWNLAGVKQTYYMSNVAPQASSFNQQGWRILEEHLSDYSVAENALLLAVVGVAYDHSNSNNIRVHSAEGTWIPNWWWYAVCRPDEKSGFAVFVPNENTGYPDGMNKDIGISALNSLLETYKVIIPGGSILPRDCWSENKWLDIELSSVMDQRSDEARMARYDNDLCPDNGLDGGAEVIDPNTGDIIQNEPEGDCRASVVVVAPSVDADGLIFTRYYEGSGYDKCVEFKTYGHAAINLDGYELQLFTNGNSEVNRIQQLSGELPPDKTYVVCNPAANADILVWASLTSSAMNFNGDDQIRLYNKNKNQIEDVVGINGQKVTVNNVADALTNNCIVRNNTTAPCSDPATWCPSKWTVVHSSDNPSRFCDFTKANCAGQCRVFGDGGTGFTNDCSFSAGRGFILVPFLLMAAWVLIRS